MIGVVQSSGAVSDAVFGTVAAVILALAALLGEVLRRRLRDVSDAIGDPEPSTNVTLLSAQAVAQLGEALQWLASLREQMGRIERRQIAADERMTVVESRINGHDSAIARLHARVDSIDSDVRVHGERITACEVRHTSETP